MSQEKNNAHKKNNTPHHKKETTQKSKNPSYRSAIGWSVGGITAALLLGLGTVVAQSYKQDNVVAPHFIVMPQSHSSHFDQTGFDIGGLDRETGIQKLREHFEKEAVTIKLNDTVWKKSYSDLGISAQAEALIDRALEKTKNRSLSERLMTIIGRAPQYSEVLSFQTDKEKMTAALKELTKNKGTAPTPAEIGFNNKQYKYVIVKSDTIGLSPNIEEAVNRYITQQHPSVIQLSMKEHRSKQSAEALAPLLAKGNGMIRPLTVGLEGSSRRTTLTAAQVANLYWVKPEGIVLDEEAISKTFTHLKNTLDDPAHNARYIWKNGAYVAVPERNGYALEPESALQVFKDALTDPSLKHTNLPAHASQPTLKLAQLPNPASLKLIARGESTYTGSSPERRTNVANAAQKIDGTIVPAGGTFSFLNSLGNITPENGFVGGLIISGGRTVDGLGGGVCQVSTTAFRALYSAGLPVTERHQHSYRVRYYEPHIGFEAAVYDPGLDLKFKNDTGGTIMVKTTNYPKQSRLVIEVWGTVKPEREVSVSRATILSSTPNPPAKWVNNPNLRAGQVKQVDWAQNGYNLYITRTIKDEQGTRTDKTSTVYKPWQAVYERGTGN